VEEQQHWAVATTPIADLVAVDGYVFHWKLICGGDMRHGIDRPFVPGT
jgi:hypothetical protein